MSGFLKRHRLVAGAGLLVALPAIGLLNSTSATATAGYRNAVLADQPVAYWRLGESTGATVATSETGQYEGTYLGSPALGQPGLISEEPDTSAGLDGVDDRVTANGVASAATSWPGLTLEAWIEVTRNVPAAEEHAVQFSTASGGHAPGLFHDDPSNKFKFAAGGDPDFAISDNVTSIGSVYHVVGTVGTDNVSRLFVNGVQQTDTGIMTKRPVPGWLFQIGADYDAGPVVVSFWQGRIDEVAVYDKALTGDQIAAHYSAGLPTPTPTPTPTTTPLASPTPTPSQEPSPTPAPTPTPTPEPTPTPAPSPSPAPLPSSTPGGRKVMWIVMGSRSYSVLSSTAAPYLRGTLVPTAGSATNMHSETHPSLPNYLAMTTGSTQGVADDNPPRNHKITSMSIFSQVDPSWKTYAEAMPSNCFQKDGSFSNGTKYVVRHNPATYMVASPLNAPNADCNINDVPAGTTSLGRLITDLNTGSLPNFSFVVPGLCHDMQPAPSGNSCSPTDAIAAGDQWLAQWMPMILQSPDYVTGRLVVFLTWDQGIGGSSVKGMNCLSPTYLSDNGCRIPTLVFSTKTPKGSQVGTLFSHYSMIKSTEELLGFPTDTLGSNVSGATSMSQAFNLLP